MSGATPRTFPGVSEANGNEGLLAALELYEIRLLVPQLRVLAPVTIAAQPRLATDDFGAELAQHAPDRRTCRSGRQLDNAKFRYCVRQAETPDG